MPKVKEQVFVVIVTIICLLKIAQNCIKIDSRPGLKLKKKVCLPFPIATCPEIYPYPPPPPPQQITASELGVSFCFRFLPTEQNTIWLKY